MAKKVLVLSASVGGGHMRAAEAVELALRELDPSAEVTNVDVLMLTNKAFRRVYAKAYLDLVNKAPHVLGYFYDALDAPRRHSPGYRDRLRVLVEGANLDAFKKLLKSQRWDIIVNTHFLPAGIIARRKRKGRLSTPQMVVTTDFETHRLWLNDPCERYFTATDEGAAYLESFGIDRERIAVSGIPIHPVFRDGKDRDACLREHELDGSRPIVLQLAGGFGTGPIEAIFRNLLSVETPLQVVVVTGRNEKALKKLSKSDVPAHHRVKVMGFTTEIDELMRAADVVLSKPGGLTTSESLARGCAMAVVNPTPGQESRNSDFLLENGAAIKINNIATLPVKLGALLADRDRLETLKRNALRIARPAAAFTVARAALEWAGE